jgi:hypothetical protein
MKIHFQGTIEVSAESLAVWAGINLPGVRENVGHHLTAVLPDLPGFADTDAVVRWNYVGGGNGLRGQPHPVYDYQGRTRWPTSRASEP